MFSKLLIANRGEIAVRVIKTAKKLGIRTVAIYSDVDKNSLHIKLADEAYPLNATLALESYLDIEKIIQIAKAAHVDAIHPGYGFLSENPVFAKACQKEHIVFVGPPTEAMDLMASKQRAKQCLSKTDVPMTPGYHEQDQSEKTLLKAAKAIGFPVLLKAAAGGGGKGMRRVDNEKEFGEALLGAKRESLASFSDDTMLIEKCIENPRHVEIQIMADSHGQVVHLFERDCSIQRRHQKIIEEAPAPNLSDKLRAGLAKAAVTVAKQIHYVGAGTIEFLVDGDAQFYFMEMNTRLQVEHPVTEMITGLDLVEWQLRIAAGEPLPLSQAQIESKGHAIECRIYAEDTEAGGLPSTGTLRVFETPDFPDVRLDTGFIDQDVVTRFYDPMLGKLIAFGPTREIAAAKLHEALMHYVLGGLKTNVPYLRSLIASEPFKAIQLGTDFLTTHDISAKPLEVSIALLLATAVFYLSKQSENTLLNACIGFQTHGNMRYPAYFEIDNTRYTTHITPKAPHRFLFEYDEQVMLIEATMENALLTLNTPQLSLRAFVALDAKNHCTLHTKASPTAVTFVNSPKVYESAKVRSGSLTAPMPATIVAILKAKGDEVAAGDSLIVLEAMKMEHTIRAPSAGKLTDIFFPIGAQVNEGATLAALEASKEET